MSTKNTKKSVITRETPYGIELDETIVPDDYITTEGKGIDLDGIEECSVPALGAHRVRIIEWESVKEKWREPNDGKEHSADEITYMPAHIALKLRDQDNTLAYSKNVYSNSVLGMMKSINRQYKGMLGGMNTRKMLDFLKAHDFNIWAVWNDEAERVDIFFFDKERADAMKRLGIEENAPKQ